MRSILPNSAPRNGPHLPRPTDEVLCMEACQQVAAAEGSTVRVGATMPLLALSSWSHCCLALHTRRCILCLACLPLCTAQPVNSSPMPYEGLEYCRWSCRCLCLLVPTLSSRSISAGTCQEISVGTYKCQAPGCEGLQSMSGPASARSRPSGAQLDQMQPQLCFQSGH